MRKSDVTRRDFLKRGTAVSTAAMFSAWTTSSVAEEQRTTDWKTALEDPVYAMLSGQPDLNRVLALFPHTIGKPAFDPQAIAENIRKLKPVPAIDTGHPLLDLSVKAGLAHIDATFRGDHPKYGVGAYADQKHDGFPPTIVAAVDALSAWGISRRAKQLFRYWLATFVRQDGTVRYCGGAVEGGDATSIAEFGQLLHTAALLAERGGTAEWWMEGFKPLDRIAEHLLQLQAAAVREDGLISGVPEADKNDSPGKFFHNNAWAAKGLRRWAELCERQKGSPTTAIPTVRKLSAELGRDTLRAIGKRWPADPADWWLPPQVEPLPKPTRLAGEGWDVASYTNYRYWPELLSSGLLPAAMANRIVAARLGAGGQFCGMTRFADHLDDWPLVDYLYALRSLGRKNDFLLSLYGHVAYHQAEGHLTAYEQVSFPPGRAKADYCLPCQLVVARAARLLQK